MTDEKKLKALAEQALIGEIGFQCRLAERAANQLEKASGPIETWGSIQSLLVAAANVSKILWPKGEAYRGRAEQLQELLGVDEHKLLPALGLRNHFEHYDERIERYFDGSNSAVYMDLAIDSLEPTPGALPRFYHRHYNPSSQTVSFRDDPPVDLREVVAALMEILEKCRGLAFVDWDQ